MSTPRLRAAKANGRQMVNVLMMTDVQPQHVGAPSLLRGLSTAEIEAVVSAGQLLVLNKGARLFSQGTLHDGIFLIRSGRIRVFYVAPSGREITLGYWFPGNFVGAPEIFKRGLHDWSGTAASNSSVLQLKGEVLREMVERMPALSIGIIEGLTFKGKCYSALAQMLGTRSATERLVHLLLHLMTLYGVEESTGIVIAAPLTVGDIAHMIGATRQWVTAVLNRLVERKILQVQGSDLTIIDRAALEQMRNSSAKRGASGTV